MSKHFVRKLSIHPLSKENTKKLRIDIHQLLISFIIDSSFNCLQSLIIEDIQPDKLISFLINLNSLPQLFSLNIRTIHIIDDLNNIYRLIFVLPTLKYNKLYLYENECSISIPIGTEKQFSTIEYLHIAHCYTFDELHALISYTPKLRHLNLSHENQDDSTIEIMLPITLDNLTYISMYTNYINFDEFEIFIKHIYSNLKTLYVTFLYQDIAFLYAHRWEQLILRYLSQLKKFSSKYYEYKYSLCIQIYHLDIQQSISIDKLMQIIHLLPDLITLKINSLTFYRSLINEKFSTTCSIGHAKFLNVECINGMTIELFLRDILNKINLRSS
ncbi:unnamed protein product [Rotaria sp. Silwood2]|nr:unnamed protein product [Rotaria sp. Silwood2]